MKEYQTKEEASNCYKMDNTCDCLKRDMAIIAIEHKHTDYSKDGDVTYFEVCVDFINLCFLKRWVTYSPLRVKKSEHICPITNCPFCGRELIGGDSE
jgi:hypothetical protein